MLDGINILSFGGGVDSSAILELCLTNQIDLKIDHVIFADTGAEKTKTYDVVHHYKQRCQTSDIPFTIVRKKGENIYQWVTRLGIIPLMPGGAHICSKKFKGDVIQKFVNRTFPNQHITYIIGIEANEQHRLRRFQKPKDDEASYIYPLVDLNIDRDTCLEILKSAEIDIPKSSCVFCPYMSVEEIKDAYANKSDWNKIKTVEQRFSEMSERKHLAWLKAGKPLNKGGKCNKGHWRKDSWKQGARLFAKRIDRKQLSISEWEELIQSGRI